VFCAHNGFIPKRADRLACWIVRVRQDVCPNEVGSPFFQWKFHVDNHGRAWHRSASDAACHGSLPVYISRASSEPPIIPPLIRQSTLAPTLSPQPSSVQSYRPEVLPHTSRLDIRSKPPQAGDRMRPSEPSEPQETSQSNESPQSSRPPHKSKPALSSAASMLTLADSIYPAPSLGGASSYRTCEESIRV
jgi:hypothetical protein